MSPGRNLFISAGVRPKEFSMYKLPIGTLRYLVAALFTLVALPSSAAYLQFTYTNQDLLFTSLKIEGVPTVIDDFVPVIPSFSISFTLPEKDLSLQPTTSFFTRQLNLTLDSDVERIFNFPINLSPSSYAQVSLNQMGQITSWNLVAFARELVTPETNLERHRLEEVWVNVRSNSASGDLLTIRYHTTTRRQLTLIQTAELEFNYADETSLNNWTLARMPVPEPGLAGLLLGGLTVLLWRRRNDKKTAR